MQSRLLLFGVFMLALVAASILGQSVSPAPSFSSVTASPSDPGCASAADIKKFWLDTTSSVTTHLKVCAAVSSSTVWVQVF